MVHCRLDIRKYSFSQRTIYEWAKSTDCVNANMLKTKIDRYIIRAGYASKKYCWTFAKPKASLSTCHVEFTALGRNIVRSG